MIYTNPHIGSLNNTKLEQWTRALQHNMYRISSIKQSDQEICYPSTTQINPTPNPKLTITVHNMQQKNSFFPAIQTQSNTTNSNRLARKMHQKMRNKNRRREKGANLAAFADHHGDGGGKIDAFLGLIGDEIGEGSGTKEERREKCLNGPEFWHV